ncbi:MAG TPA: hypothetical protein PKA90_03095 [Ignavibacteria bacterium]|nr:hypothetical protein [Ignavibacteria bacterium]HMR39395.1 hypothetical protein [Ignavibacteria bacterium]
MENTKVIKLLKSFNQNEIKQFRDFVNSPVFNKKEILIRVTEELKKHYPEFSKDKLGEEKFFGEIFPGENYNYFKLKNTLSDLFMLGKEFLAFNRFRNDEMVKERYILDECRLRNLMTFFKNELKTADDRIEKLPVKDEIYFFRKLELTLQELSFLVPQTPNKHLHFQQKMLDLFLNYSIIKIFRSYNVMMHEEKQNNVEYEKHLLNEIMSFVEESKIENPTMQIYYHIISLERNHNDDNFHKLKEAGSKYKDDISVYDSYMVFLHLNGYCTNEFNINTRTDLFKEQFELVRDKDSRDYTSLGKLLYPDFISEIKISLRYNQIEWAEDYIVRNTQRLSSDAESAVNFCNAMINVKKGNPDKALELLSKTNFPNFIIKLQVKILELQIYFDKEYFDQVSSAIDNFRHYLKRENTIKENFKDSFYEFVNILNALIKLNTGYYGNEKDFYIDKIRNEIEIMTTNQFGIKLWLREKADYLSS